MQKLFVYLTLSLLCWCPFAYSALRTVYLFACVCLFVDLHAWMVLQSASAVQRAFEGLCVHT